MTMKLFLVCLVVVTLGAACANQSQPALIVDVATTTPSASTSPLSPLAVPQTPEMPASENIEEEAPLAVATPTSLPYTQRYSANGMRIEVTPIPHAPQVTCIPQGEVIACYDELLDMDFSYPVFMGQLLYTMLRKGGYSGYAYAYAFEDRESAAGGRSSDFSEGRGPTYTDATGFNGRSSEEICAGWMAALCQQLSPSAVLIVMLPQAEWLCSDAMFVPIPRGILVLDLPQHPLIQGFSFSFELMSAEVAEAFREEWYMHGRDCEPETKAELSAAMEQLRQDLQAGTADAEIQQRYDAMIQIAESIQSPFIAANP